MLTPEILSEVQRALADAGVDGWLLYDFRGLNPIGGDLMGLEGMTTRRVFAFVPTLGTPVAITHAIEQSQWKHWPKEWPREVYSSWRSLESYIRKHVAGKRVAMEYSPGDAVPYLDRVPAGVIDQSQVTRHSAKDEAKLPNLRESSADRYGHCQRLAEDSNRHQRGKRLYNHHHHQHRYDHQWAVHQAAGIE